MFIPVSGRVRPVTESGAHGAEGAVKPVRARSFRRRLPALARRRRGLLLPAAGTRSPARIDDMRATRNGQRAESRSRRHSPFARERISP